MAALAAWQAPAAPSNAQHFEFWTSPVGGTRARRRPDDAGVVVELTAFAPLADQVGGRVIGQRALIGAKAGDVCLPTIDLDTPPDGFTLPASERSSGDLPVKVHDDRGVVDGYEIWIGYEYDREVKAAVPALLRKRFGAPGVWKHPRVMGLECQAYGKAPIVYACDGEDTGLPSIKVWRLFVGEAPQL